MALQRRISIRTLVTHIVFPQGGYVPKNQASPMTDKELVRRLFAKSVRKKLKALLAQKDAGKHTKKTKKR